jgi:hypothetical protein
MKKEIVDTKKEIIKEFDDCTIIYKFDPKKSLVYPTETEVKWKKEFLNNGVKRTKLPKK